MSIVNKKSGKCLEEPINHIKFKYKMDDFQKHACVSINNKNHVLVTAHTGSGKTTIAEYGCSQAIYEGKNAIYTSPIKALSGQTYHDLKEKYPDWDVGLWTGDISINEEAQIVIMTTEILWKLLLGKSDRIKDTSIVIFDEVHYIKDKNRGNVWAESIVMMPKHITMIMLSATIPESEIFSEWVSKYSGGQVDLINTTHRVVPLIHNFFSKEDEKLEPIINKKNLINLPEPFFPNEINNVISFLKKRTMLPAIFFRFNKKHCEKLARTVTDTLISGPEIARVKKIFDSNIKKFKNEKGECKFNGMKQANIVKGLLMKGVCYHHSGLTHILKEIIQLVFSEGLLKVLFVTETFAAGVNMPAKTVVFLDLTKYDGYIEGKRILHPEEYHQMSGRAGRRGKDKIGNVILMPMYKVPSPHEMNRIIFGDMQPILSKFKLSYSLLLKMMENNDDIVGFINKSMMASQKTMQLIGMKSKLKSMKIEFTTTTDDDEIKDLIKQRVAINKSKQYRKKLSKFNTKLKKLDSKKIDIFEKAYKIYLEREEDRNTIESLERDYHKLLNEDVVKINNMLKFMSKFGYVKLLKEMNDQGIIKALVTVKGKMAAEVNECNELLLTEIIHGKYLDDLNFEEIIAILAIFVEEKNTDRRVELSYTINDRIKNIRKTARDYQRSEVTDLSDWSLNSEFIDLAYYWARGDSLETIYKNSDIFEGNFVKGILKIKSICNTVMKLCEIISNNELAKVLENYEKLLIRSIVTPESLHTI